MDLSSEGLVTGGHSVHLWEGSSLARDRHLVTINMLPDDVLVEIFGFSENVVLPAWYGQNLWRTLVHVCRRWRYLVFASPRRLNLRLPYHGHRPMSEALDAWPVSLIFNIFTSDRQWDNIIAALESERSNRISEISIDGMSTLRWERFAAAMQKPFPELTLLRADPASGPVLPDSFLGGSAPRLRSLKLGGIPFPSIPKLLLSAHGLVTLTLLDIPDSGYFSPDAIATALTAMTRLEDLNLGFVSPPPRPDPESRPLPPPTRFVLPALTRLSFRGVHEYLENLLARLDPPRLDNLVLTFFTALDFDVPQLHRSIGHAEEFKACHRATVWICSHHIRLEVDDGRRRQLKLQIQCRGLEHQLSSLSQVCSASWPLIFALEGLGIWEDDLLSSSHWKDNMESAEWLGLLDSFTALKNLYLTHGIATYFCGALQELSLERTTEVLPALRTLFVPWSLLKPVQGAIRAFLAARRLSGHPVVVDYWQN